MAEQQQPGSGNDELSTNAQRLRKRELDRKAQRTARMKTKNRIAHLESLVESFRHRDENGTMMALSKQLEQAREERDALMRVLMNVESSISPHLKNTNPNASGGSRARQGGRQDAPSLSSTTKGTTESPQTQTSPTVVAPLDSFDWNCVGTPALDEMQGVMDWSESSYDMAIPTAANITPNNITGSKPPSASSLGLSCDCSTARVRSLSDGKQVKFNIWRAANEILCETDPVPDTSEMHFSHEDNHDIAVRAILEGWDNVEKVHRLGPAWKKVRKLDQLGFSICSQVERLGMLWIVHLVMMLRLYPSLKDTLSLPQCYSELSSHRLPHSQAIDYFIWPGVREQFIWSEHRYCRNMFWYLLSEHLRVLWPLDFRDCFSQDTQTGQYRIATRFENTIRRMESWTMEREFFSHFPELMQTIPVFLALPIPIPERRDSESDEIVMI